MKRFAAGAITAVLMSLLIGSQWLRSRPIISPAPESLPTVSSGPSPSSRSTLDQAEGPEARVRALLARGRAGDVEGYLNCFVKAYRTRLERAAAEQGREPFAASLRQAAEARKGHAVFAAAFDGATAARVTVESVYPDRNERQTFHMEREDGAWRVADVETIRSHEPKSKFGSLATFEGPEGNPLAGATEQQGGATSPAEPAGAESP